MPARAIQRLLSTALLLLVGCGDTATLDVSQGYGPEPTLPEPRKSLLPTVSVAKAIGWPPGRTPNAAPGLQVQAFATGLDHPRTLLSLPNGDVLVTETNAPERPAARQGIRGWVMKKVMSYAGAGVPSANRITLLRDLDGDGIADLQVRFLENLNSPFGMALVGDRLYVANTDTIVRFPYRTGATHISVEGEKVASLPAGPRNHHWTKDLIASPDGRILYVTVGSNSNAAEHGMGEEENRAAILAVDIASGSTRRFASGLRNPNGLAWQPDSGELWVAVNERDEIGSDLVPDRCARAASMAGPTVTSAHMWMRAYNRRVPIWWPRPSFPITRWARIPPLWVWPSIKLISCPHGTATAPSLPSMVPGTANRVAATRLCSCRLTVRDVRRDRRRMCSPASSTMTRTRRLAGPWALR